jgi:DmsE family decaheme c-type cytochrome
MLMSRIGKVRRIALGLVCGALAGSATPASATDLGSQGDPVAALQNYIQLGDVAPPSVPARALARVTAPTRADPVAALRNYLRQTAIGQPDKSVAPVRVAVRVADRDFAGDTYAPLRGFALSLSADLTQPPARALQLADADNAYDALREFFNKQNGTAAPVQPTPPPAKGSKAAKPNAPAEPVPATAVGTKVCLTCHTDQATQFGYTLMGRLLKQGKMDCELCHGPGSAHVKAGGGVGVGGIISFRPEDTSRTADDNNAICLGCHKRGERTNWDGSIHEERGLQCSNCHTIMKSVSATHQLKTAFEPDTCFQCHKDRRAQMFRSSHMPMREGKVVCSDCHNPHGSTTEALLREDSINDTCYKCHAEKRGPFLFEHEPVRENCLNCHDPHGSVNEYSLKIARPRLCFECHGFGHGNSTGPGGFSFGASMALSCQNCHIQIHGSNSPAGGAFQR